MKKNKPTPEFLDELQEFAKIYGYSGDYTEIISFVNWCYDLAELPIPDLKPYE